MLNPNSPFVARELVENRRRDPTRRFERRVTALRNGREVINNAIASFALYGMNVVNLPLFSTRMFAVMWAAVAVTTVPIIVVLLRNGWLRQT